MEPIMVYLLDDKVPDSFEQQLNQTTPLTEEAVVGLVISQAKEREEQTFADFLNEYDTDNFQLLNLYRRRKLIEENLGKLERHYNQFSSWNDPEQLKTDLLNSERKYRKVDDKNILLPNQIELDIVLATNLLTLLKKRIYLKRESHKLDSLIKANKTGSGDEDEPHFDEIDILKKLFPAYENLGQLNNLISNMQGKRTVSNKYPTLVYKGKVNFFWKELRKIWLTNKYVCKDIANAISVHCLWQRSSTSELEEFTVEKVTKGLSREH